MHSLVVVVFFGEKGQEKHSDILLAMDNHPTVTSLQSEKSGKGEQLLSTK
jgi:hypothetical protein